MKTKSIVGSLAALALLVGAGCESHEHHLRARATISKTDAQQIALEKAPGGTVQEGELEKEHGKLVWSFDISRPGTSDITEVQVDANTGAVVSVQTESAGKEAKEKMNGEKEHHHEKGEKENEDDERENK